MIKDEREILSIPTVGWAKLNGETWRLGKYGTAY